MTSGANGLQGHRLLWERKGSLISLPQRRTYIGISASQFLHFDALISEYLLTLEETVSLRVSNP